MKKYLVLYAVAVTALFVCSHRRYRAENRRLVQNQTALAAEVAHYRTQAGQEAASAQVLRLRCGEFEALRAADADAEIRTPLRDTVVVRSGDPHPVRDSVRLFRWRDPWVTVEGRIGRDSAVCRIRSIDTLRQVVHRIPRRFLFIRWGTKALRQEIVSTNPHTRIVHAEYVKIER